MVNKDLMKNLLEFGISLGVVKNYEFQMDNTNGDEVLPRVIVHLVDDNAYNALKETEEQIMGDNAFIFVDGNFEDDDFGYKHTYGYIYLDIDKVLNIVMAVFISLDNKGYNN